MGQQAAFHEIDTSAWDPLARAAAMREALSGFFRQNVDLEGAALEKFG
jgi:hypothetical protein